MSRFSLKQNLKWNFITLANENSANVWLQISFGCRRFSVKNRWLHSYTYNLANYTSLDVVSLSAAASRCSDLLVSNSKTRGSVPFQK